ncbi:hypothetical protein LSCM1_08192 [Leishmania martiniquensis]|uniref:Uncharacterized protein n=1 Tax=Leishmania martiniquensis TaxID=1580590 RepID=A0A836I134_9TRYP|nr:hypothetical protein LSCM1_08192 [Leishmania martiniquensis]
MTSRANLDFYIRGPERRQCERERMARQRAPMYEWRHDFSESAFDAATGERRPLQRAFNPLPKQHPVSTLTTRTAAHKADAHTDCEDVEQDNHGPQHLPSPRLLWSPQQTLGDGGGAAAIAAVSARPATATTWQSAAQSISDRRRVWRHTDFAFSEDYFRTSARVSATQTRPGAAMATASAVRHGAGRSGAYVPYLHDTILFCEPRPHPKELRTRGLGAVAGAAAAADQLPPMCRASSAARVVLAVTCNAAESRARELQASMDAKRRELQSLPTSAPLHKSSQPQPTPCLYSAAGESFTDEDDDAAARAVDDRYSVSSDVRTAAAEQVETCCDVAGPSIAVKQRAAALAEGVYTDLILNRAKAWSASPAVAASKTEIPTCELAYSLRPSYLQSRLCRSAARRSSSSSQSIGIVGITSDCYSASLDAGASGTTQHTTAATSPMTGYAPAPRIRGHRGNGVSRPPSERAVTRSPANESLAGVAAAVADVISFALRSGNTAHHSSTTTAPPQALSPIDLGRDEGETDEARSPDRIDGQATSKTSPTAAAVGAQAGHLQGCRLTASPPPNGRNAQLQPGSHPSPSLLYRTRNSTDSPTLLSPCGDGGGSTVAGGSSYGGGDGRQRRCPHGRHSKASRGRAPGGPSERDHMRDGALPQHPHSQRSVTAHRLPVESKETRVYAVRVRRFFKAESTPLKRAEPPRQGVPVMLPQDWQQNC